MKNKSYILLCLGFIFFNSCDYFDHDNYDAPDSVLQGAVYDAKTGEPLSTETGLSFKIEYYELSWAEAGHPNTEPRFFWGKADGTFMNTKIFAGKYRITLKEGAFLDSEPKEVTLSDGKATELKFDVIPYARVNIDTILFVGENKNDLEIKYTVEDTRAEAKAPVVDEEAFKLAEARIFISGKSPNVGVNNNETIYSDKAVKDISNYIPGKPESYIENNIAGLPAGKWWIRVGVRTNNPQKRYNFTPVREITIP